MKTKDKEVDISDIVDKEVVKLKDKDVEISDIVDKEIKITWTLLIRDKG